MKKKAFSIILFMTVIQFVSGITAADIIERADKVFKADRVYSLSVLTVYRNGKAQPSQEIEGFTMGKNGKTYSLSIYKSPRRMKGTAMLTVENDLWVRFPSTGRVRKLSSSAKKNSAGGSDFSYADMGEVSGGFSEKFRSVLIGEEKMDGIDCYVVKLAAGEKGAPYEKIVAYISKDDYRYLRIEYFEEGANIKTMKLYDYREKGGLNYPFRIVMQSHVKDSKTEIVTRLFEPDSSRVQDRFFTTGYLQSIR